ncbi:MAG: M23 family metallopeptidase [Bacteroidales bacterium]|nr:M23 family metallopeptidase [Bacteroidales bacterium]MDD3200770.1 M23 family metallopeptidase [Bacteroidales bacterium]
MAKQARRQKEKRSNNNLRINIINSDSHKALFSVKFTKFTLILVLSLFILLLIVGTYLVTSRTAVKYTIPGYPSAATKQMAVENVIKIDSLERIIEMWSMQLTNIQRIVSGREPVAMDSIAQRKNDGTIDAASREMYAKDDSILREEILKQERFNISYNTKKKIEQIEGLHFFTPVKGIITEDYNKAINHPFVDIAAAVNTIVYAVLDGTVVYAGWNDDTGYTIQIQHDNDIISTYKHNEKLLKSVGDKVTAGTPIALVGNTGNLSTGSHLHFELWHKGEAVDPTLYIKF